MKRSRLYRFVLIPLLAVLPVAPATWAQGQRADATAASLALDAATIAQIERIFAHFGNATPGAALAIVRDGEIAYEAGHGMANLEYDVPITPASTFHVASISTSLAASRPGSARTASPKASLVISVEKSRPGSVLKKSKSRLPVRSMYSRMISSLPS